MEKEKISLGQLTPEENEKRVVELESEMRKSGAEFEVNSKAPPTSWHKRLLQRIKIRLGLILAFTTILLGLGSATSVHASTWQTEMDNFDPNRWQGETMVNAAVYIGDESVSTYYLMAEIDGELRGFVKEPQRMERDGVVTYIYNQG